MTDYIDPIGVPEFFCEKLHSIAPAGPCRRLMFTIHQMEGERRIPIGVVKLVLTVSEDVADTVMRIVLEQDPHATRAPDPDLDAAGHATVAMAIREARVRGQDAGEAELRAARAWWRQWGGQK